MIRSQEKANRSIEKRGLPLRMYAHGMSYRLHFIDGRKVNLGRDLSEALRRYYALMEAPRGQENAKELKPAFMLSRHRKGAKQRGLAFDLSEADIDEALESQGYCCAITGAAFSTAKVEGMRIRPWLPSIDRIDSSSGYLRGNIRIVCGFVNIAMKAFGEKLFTSVIKGLIETEVKARLRRAQMAADELSIPAVGSRGNLTGINHCTEAQTASVSG